MPSYLDDLSLLDEIRRRGKPADAFGTTSSRPPPQFSVAAPRFAPPSGPQVYMAPAPADPEGPGGHGVHGGGGVGGNGGFSPPGVPAPPSTPTAPTSPIQPPTGPATPGSPQTPNPPKITPHGPTDGGGTQPEDPKTFQPPALPGYKYEGQGFQAPTRDPVQAFQRQAFEVPPPPPPPKAPPPSADFSGIVGGMPGMQRAGAYNPTAAPAAAPDFQAIADRLGGAKAGPQYRTAAGSYTGEKLSPELEQYARDTLENPNRYTTPWMQSALAAINGQIDLSRDEGQRNLAELMAKRGTLGSTIEQQGAGNLEAQLDQTRLAQLSDLLENMAAVNAQDRTAAANIGLGVGQFQQSLGNDRRSEGQFQYNADTQRARNLEADKEARVNTALSAAGQQEAANQYRGNFAQAENQFGAQFDRQTGLDYEQALQDRAALGLQAGSLQNRADLDRFQAALQNQQFLEQTRNNTANLNLQSQDLDLRAYQIQQDAIARGQQLDLDTAKAMAQNELDRNQMGQQESQYARTLQEQQQERAVQERLAKQQEEHQEFLDNLALAQYLAQYGAPPGTGDGDGTGAPASTGASSGGDTPKTGDTKTIEGETFEWNGRLWVKKR